MLEKIELVLLPPSEKKQVTEEDIARAYAEIINILTSRE